MISAVWKYSGATPGADTTERDLFNTVTAFGYGSSASAGSLQRTGISRLLVASDTTGAVNIKFYYSTDSGVTWIEDTTYAWPLAAGSNQTDIWVQPYAQWDCKVTATNAAASAQTRYNVTITGVSDRSVAS